MIQEPTRAEIEALMVNNDDIGKITRYLSRFNPIKTMGMAHMEIRHSSILGWLMDPQETHGLGDRFLKAFLAEAMRDFNRGDGPSALEISLADMSDAEIRREWQNIDLLVISPRNNWIFVIENKFHSTLHSNQLTRYLEVATRLFTGSLDDEAAPKICGVFLTLWGEEPDNDLYAPIQYNAVCDLLEAWAFNGGLNLTPEITTFIKHYLEIIQEVTGMNKERSEMEILARQIYRHNKKAFDFIMEHGRQTDFAMAVEEIFGEDKQPGEKITINRQSLVYLSRDAHVVSFIPQSWKEALEKIGPSIFEGCEGYWSGFPFAIWLQLTHDGEGGGGHIRLYAEVGPIADAEMRKRLIDKIEEKSTPRDRISFNASARKDGARTSKIFKQNAFPLDDMHDAVKIQERLLQALESFRPELEVVAQALTEFAEGPVGSTTIA